MTGDLTAGLTGELSGIDHLVFVFAEDCPAGEHPDLAQRATECRAYHTTPEGEDRQALWAEYAAELSAAGYRFSSPGGAKMFADDLRTGNLAEVTVVDVDDAGLGVVVEALRSQGPAATLVAVALGGGDALAVVDTEGSLGSPGTLLLLTPGSPGGWVSEEVLDHTSLIQLCERWTKARGREVPADLPAWRRRLVGDLVGTLTFDEGPLELTYDTGGRRPARPVPYFPVVDLRLDEDGASLLLANLGPTATRAAHLVVDDGAAVSHHTVPGSPTDGPGWVEVPVAVRDGRYDVSVLGPNHFRRRYAGSFPSPVRCACDHFGAGDAWFPDLVLTLSHATTVPVFFWLERRLGTRYGGAKSERLLGPRQIQSFREQPGARTHGWYDLSVTTSADQEWVQEYAGHLHAGSKPSLSR